jgi:hypothetical protein
MNEEPHTHTVELRRSFMYIDEGGWLIHYGDTEAHVWSWIWNRLLKKPPSPRAVRAATRRVIRKHNRGSRNAGTHAVERSSLQAVAEQVADKETW